MSLIAELKRRNVIRMAGLYLVGAWLIAQVAETILPAFEVPNWVMRAIVIVLALGFVPAVIVAWVFELTPDGIKRDQDVDRSASIAPKTAQRMNRTIIVLMVVALGYFAVDKMLLAPQRDAALIMQATKQATAATQGHESNANPTSIAVLPFVNMSSDKEQDYFSDGLSEELLNQLAQIPQLRVIARTSSFSFKGKEIAVAQIAKALDVDHVLEGSVRKSGDTLRITAQLIRTSDSSHLWSQTYDRKLTDIFKVQDEIAGAVVTALKLKLLPAQQIDSTQRPASTDAYNQYLLGNQYNNGGAPEDWRRAEAAYRQAIVLDPDYAAAYAGLAAAQYSLADLTSDPAAKRQALATADRAIAMAPGLSQGYAARGVTRLSFFRDWAGAQADFDKALALNPGDSSIQASYWRLLMALGRVPEAIDTARKATELDPLSAMAWAGLGRALHAAGQYPAARKAIEHALEISPDSDLANYQMGKNYLLQADPGAALIAFKRSGLGYRTTGIAMAEYSLGHEALSLQALEQEADNVDHHAAYQVAVAYAWRGEKGKAFEWLDRAFALNDGGLSFLKSDPLMAGLVTDPRYAALLKKLGLPE